MSVVHGRRQKLTDGNRLPNIEIVITSWNIENRLNNVGDHFLKKRKEKYLSQIKYRMEDETKMLGLSNGILWLFQSMGQKQKSIDVT